MACQAVAKGLLKDLQGWKESCFADWTQLTLDKLGDIKVDKSGKLMDMDSQDGRIELHYNDELVVLLREVRNSAHGDGSDLAHWQHAPGIILESHCAQS